MEPIRLNLGCGRRPSPGYLNFDSSPSIRLARVFLVAKLLRRLRLLNGWQFEFIEFARSNRIGSLDVTRRFPFADVSVDGIYTCHVFEHLQPRGTRCFLSEAFRVLKPDGWVRTAVPDLRRMVEAYLKTGDADSLIDETRLGEVWKGMTSLRGRLQTLWFGQPACHKWMYDGPSLMKRMKEAGFDRFVVVPAGETSLPNIGDLNLRERETDSVYVEARKPSGLGNG